MSATVGGTDRPRAGLRESLLLFLLAVVFIALRPPVASAYLETTDTPVQTPDPALSFSHNGCSECHGDSISGGEGCGSCHYGFGDGHGQGPHGYYSDLTGRCSTCHQLHDAAGPKLLPAETVTDACFTCHDGTAGHGVYGAIAANGGTVGAQHRVDTTTTIPGGDAGTGGASTRTFRGLDGNLGCDDCHSPHNANTVAPFIGDRQRTTLKWQKNDVRHHVLASSKLLKKRPTGSSQEVDEYGADWCLGCHEGRASGGAVHNHPVDSLVSTDTPFDYNHVAILVTDGPTGSTEIDGLGGWNRPPYNWVDPEQPYSENRGFLMPYPRTPDQAGHAPICQQCHEDSRSVGALAADGATADAEPFVITHEDGTVDTDNPRFQNFPHEAENPYFLAEPNDDLCMNCHPPGILP